MRTLYLECNMGAAGDMLMAALLELHGDPDGFLKRLNGIGIPGVTVRAEAALKCGIKGTHVHVEIDGREEGEPHGDSHANLGEYRHESEAGHEHSHEHQHEHSHDHRHEHHHEHSHEHRHEHSHEHHNEHSNEHRHESLPHNGQKNQSETNHIHNSYESIEHLLTHLHISETVKSNALAVYKLIAEAESLAHGVPVTQIHIHEVGEMDAVADIVGVCMLMEELAPGRVVASPVNVGSGQVRCAHGILPVPAPATAHILQGIPMYGDKNVTGELCTPTGAALLKHFVSEFREMPVIRTEKIGYGMGKKDFPKANCVRAYLGVTGDTREDVCELVCNLDDMTPEAVAFAQQLLFDEGALDVYTAPIGMKKSRLGVSFTCMCRMADRDKMLALIFKHTSTLGIREYVSRRYTLQKTQHEVDTGLGVVRVKASVGYGTEKSKPEFEDVARIAKENHLSLQDIIGRL
jgi:uncharacterized protein (TIGR00299 family) protein